MNWEGRYRASQIFNGLLSLLLPASVDPRPLTHLLAICPVLAGNDPHVVYRLLTQSSTSVSPDALEERR